MRAFREAVEARDFAAIESLLSDDVVFTTAALADFTGSAAELTEEAAK